MRDAPRGASGQPPGGPALRAIPRIRGATGHRSRPAGSGNRGTLDGEDLLDGRAGLPLSMAAAHETRPHQVGGLLEPREHDVPAPHVLVEAQLAARPQHPAELRERGRHVGHRHSSAHATTASNSRQPPEPVPRSRRRPGSGPGPPPPPRPRGCAGTARARPPPPPVPRRDNAGSSARCPGPPPAPGPQPGQHLPPVLPVAALLVTPAVPGEPPREERIIHQCHVDRQSSMTKESPVP